MATKKSRPTAKTKTAAKSKPTRKQSSSKPSRSKPAIKTPVEQPRPEPPPFAKTQADAIQQLAERGIHVSIRTLRDWFTLKDCPGQTEQGYAVDAIEEWAALNSAKTAEDYGEASKVSRKINQQIKEQELEIKRLKAADMQRADDAARGNILALSDCIELITAIVAVARTELMAVPKEVASIATDTGLQQQIVTEGSQRVAKILDSLAAKLARVPQQVREDED